MGSYSTIFNSFEFTIYIADRISYKDEIFEVFLGISLNQILPINMPDYMVKRSADKQHFDCTTFVRKSYLCTVMICACFGPRHSPYSDQCFRTPDIIAVGTVFLIFSVMTQCGAEN